MKNKRQFKIITTWVAEDIIELTEEDADELLMFPGRLGNWVDQVNANGASLDDWEVEGEIK